MIVICLKKKLALMVVITISLLTGCNGVSKVQSESQPISHEIWDSLLQSHIYPYGEVDYKGLIQDSLKLNRYIDLISTNHPNDQNWTKDEQLAYWINAYNVFTIRLIIRNYPLTSINNIKNGIPFVNSVWDIKSIKIEDQTYDLNNIEHGILRKFYNEPRIHFAINCASKSCPKLRNEAYTANKIEDQLNEQARAFINNQVKNKILSDQEIKLSKIFKWFRGDFTKERELVDFINTYSNIQILNDASISYMDYDWRLNDKSNKRISR